MKEEYYKTKDLVEEYIKLAKGVNGSELIEKLKMALPPGSTLLELGTGPGADWHILNKDYEVVGSDNSKEFLNHLAATHPSGKFVDLDAVTLDTDEKYDGLYSNKVLHHLQDDELKDSIKRQYDVLNPDGIICHSFWRGEGSEIFKGLFVNYHTEEALTAFFQKYFEISLIARYEEFEEGDSILLIGKKKNTL